MRISKNSEEVVEAEVANTFFSRLKGLMFRSKLPKNKGLLIEFAPYSSSRTIHGFFMRFAVELIFIDENHKVVEIAPLKPWKFYTPKRHCKWVLEVNEGAAKEKGIKEGDELVFLA